MAKAVLVMDMPKTCKDCSCKYFSYKDYALYDCAITGKTVPIDGGRYGENHIGARFGNCRRKQIILIIVIMEDLIKAGMPAWMRF